jgi:DnaJ-class molecular chaperone
MSDFTREGGAWTAPAPQPFACPVCGGRGHVPAGFFSDVQASTSLNLELCRACEGKGVVWRD